MRCYTQNIDGLEARLGMSSELEHGTKARVIPLHGDLETLKCTLCKSKYVFSQDYINCFKDGLPPACPNCSLNNETRTALGERKVAVGELRPNIVLYNEIHEFGDIIADLTTRDVRKRPDLLLVMGTSLKVIGIKKLVKHLANTVHAGPHRQVILVNRAEPVKSEWEDIFDYHIQADTDHAVLTLEALVNKLETEHAAKKSVSRRCKTENCH